MFTAIDMEGLVKAESSVDDIDPEIFKHLICFIYCGNLSDNLEVLMSLFEAANSYRIQLLKGICSKEIHKKLSKENAVEIHKWSSVNEVHDLKSASWLIIKRSV